MIFDIRTRSFLARVRFWFVAIDVDDDENVCIAKNMGHAERDHQIAKRTIYSSKTKWTKSTKPESPSLSLSLSACILFYAKRNETNSPDDWQKNQCVVIPRRFTMDTRPYPFSSSFFYLYFSFFFLSSASTFVPPCSTKQGFSIFVKKGKKKKREKMEARTRHWVEHRRQGFSKSVMDGLMAPTPVR